jgi:sugar phosphate isomerase/epimerase
MVELASARGIRLCHENEAKIYGEFPREVCDLLDEIPELFGIFDAANYRMAGANIMHGIGATLKNFAYVHIKDAIFETKTIVPAGEGEGKIAEVLDAVDGHTNERVILTVEPHLHVFDAYKDIDERKLRGKRVFNTSREAFDFAVNALKALLTENGYERNGNNEWTR